MKPHTVQYHSLTLPRPSQAQLSFSAPYSRTLSAYVPSSMWRTKFHIRKITVLYILIFISADSEPEDRRFWIEWLEAYPESNLLNFLVNEEPTTSGQIKTAGDYKQWCGSGWLWLVLVSLRKLLEVSVTQANYEKPHSRQAIPGWTRIVGDSLQGRSWPLHIPESLLRIDCISPCSLTVFYYTTSGVVTALCPQHMGWLPVSILSLRELFTGRWTCRVYGFDILRRC